MSRWFRFYDAALEDPKVQRLTPPLFKTWVNILCIASRCDGKLPSATDMAWSLRMDDAEFAEHLKALVAAGLIDSGPDGHRPHGWETRQYQSDSSAERMKRHREKKDVTPSDTARDVTVTLQKRTDTDTEEEQKERKKGIEADASPDNLIILPDPRADLYSRGVRTLSAMTGRPDDKLKSILGRWLKLANDDAVKVLRTIEDAARNRVADAVPWIEAALRAPKPEAQTKPDWVLHREKMQRWV